MILIYILWIKQADKNTLPLDQMNNGPVQDRSCTDVLFCLVFIIFLAGMAAVTGYGMLYGNP